MPDFKEKKWKLWNVRLYNINTAIIDEQEKIKKERRQSDDTTKRKEIQAFIRDNRAKNKSKLEILSALYEKFGGIEYGDYHRYFESWVNHALRGRNDRDEGR